MNYFKGFKSWVADNRNEAVAVLKSVKKHFNLTQVASLEEFYDFVLETPYEVDFPETLERAIGSY